VVAAGGETLDLPAVCARANAELGKTQRISALKQLDELTAESHRQDSSKPR
jgi:hypothetical protein